MYSCQTKEWEAHSSFYLYTINGQLVEKVRIEAGKQWMPLANGIYIVTIGKGSCKVAVK